MLRIQGVSAVHAHPLASEPAPLARLVNIPRLVTAYYVERPDPALPEHRVAFGTSDHRGSSFSVGFNRASRRPLRGVPRIPYERARRAPTLHRVDYLSSYVKELGAVIDMEVLEGTRLNVGVDPLGGASVAYWEPIAARYGFRLDVVNRDVDPTFRFMTLDWVERSGWTRRRPTPWPG